MDLATIRALYRYNSWANERTLDAVSHVSLADLSSDMKSSHGSIRDTLAHVVWSEWIWLQRWKGVSPTTRLSPTDCPTVASLREAFRAVDAERSTVLGQLTAERLLHLVEYTNLKGETWRYPLWQQLHHVVNHGTYHRGQVVTMLRQLGATPEATDFLVYCDQQPA